ncbi:MAG: 5-(carboxyamino)imidazole ribonucleotide synthase [Bacteroidia bacterium]
MNSAFYGNFKLGILGGGQLGRMLVQEAINLSLSVAILDPDKNAPCKEIVSDFTVGDIRDFETVYQFGKTVNLLTIEIEHVNVDALERLEKEGLAVYPQPNILRMIQDKGLQKKFYSEHNFPTADYFLSENKLETLSHKAHFPFMQKLRKGGYDGKGVMKLSNESDIEKSFDAPSVLEKLIDFEKEISVIVARNKSGESACFPAVEMEFNAEANLVEFLFSPADISEKTEKKSTEIALQIVEKLGIVGLLAVEMFVTKDGEILVNEMAPRPHNSGHQTIEGNFTSQYAQHLRAILNLPLGDTKISSPSVMVNLLGDKNFQGDVKYEGLEAVLAEKEVYVHLYGKKMTKPFRKMGHVTILAETIEKAKKKAIFVKEKLKVIS